MLEYIYKLGIFAFAIYCAKEVVSILFKMFGHNKCDHCDRELVPCVDEKYVICQNCIDKEQQ